MNQMAMSLYRKFDICNVTLYSLFLTKISINYYLICTIKLQIWLCVWCFFGSLELMLQQYFLSKIGGKITRYKNKGSDAKMRKCFLGICPYYFLYIFQLHKIVAYTSLFFSLVHSAGHLVNFYHASTQPYHHLNCMSGQVIKLNQTFVSYQRR